MSLIHIAVSVLEFCTRTEFKHDNVVLYRIETHGPVNVLGLFRPGQSQLRRYAAHGVNYVLHMFRKLHAQLFRGA
jgi:hypothetical protein